jgi:PAS domain S-box-containing protein
MPTLRDSPTRIEVQALLGNSTDPLVTGGILRGRPSLAAALSATTGASILIVDDDVDSRNLIEMFLWLEGYVTRTAANSEEAFAAIEREPPALITLDHEMPGMSGVNVARKLKANPKTSGIPIIMLTVHSDRAARLAALDGGAEEFVSKPVDRAELSLRVRNLLRLKWLNNDCEEHVSVLKRGMTERAACLEASELRFRQLAESIRDVFFLRDIHGGHTYYVSPAYEEIWGRTCESLYLNPDSWAEAIHPEDRQEAMEKNQAGLMTGDFELEFRIVRPDGAIRWIETRVFPVFADGAIVRIAGVAKDITDRKAADLATAASLRETEILLKEKEILFKEVHHRVKNNMQVISSLLRLESHRIDHPTTKAVLTDMQNRIHAMALLHEALYRSENVDRVDLASYLKAIGNRLCTSLHIGSAIKFQLDVSPFDLSLDQAIPCGLIVNELVSNSLKHAFVGGQGGHVRIQLQVGADEQLRLGISDDGVGLPADFDIRGSARLGLHLVADLTQQLKGTLEVGPGPGARFLVTFRRDRRSVEA